MILARRWAAWLRTPSGVLLLGLLILLINGFLTAAFAHGVAEGDKGYIQETFGFLFWPFKTRASPKQAR